MYVRLKYDNWNQNNLLYTDELNYYPKNIKIIKTIIMKLFYHLLKFDKYYQSPMICSFPINKLDYSKHSFYTLN